MVFEVGKSRREALIGGRAVLVLRVAGDAASFAAAGPSVDAVEYLTLIRRGALHRLCHAVGCASVAARHESPRNGLWGGGCLLCVLWAWRCHVVGVVQGCRFGGSRCGCGL